MNFWYTGAGKTIKFGQILDHIKKHTNKQGVVSIGTDSNVKKNKCVFSTAICLHGATNQNGSRYFVMRNNINSNNFSTLLQRITSEVQKSVDLGLKLVRLCPDIAIEIHLDVSHSNKKEGTSKFSDMLVGYAHGSGFKCRIKPDAFAASSVADKHSK
jgi:predicted RNase H-related nuclease YkuK (DUF458 family)